MSETGHLPLPFSVVMPCGGHANAFHLIVAAVWVASLTQDGITRKGVVSNERGDVYSSQRV